MHLLFFFFFDSFITLSIVIKISLYAGLYLGGGG
jgi:hypothetical protein